MEPIGTPDAPGVLRIFISYRRQDGPSYARELYRELGTHFPDSQIFWDIKMEPGVDFEEEIERAVGSCDVLVAVLGPRWLELTDDKGQRRLDDPSDFVRLEIATALGRDIRVIPVLVQGASMPASESLPEPLQRLARRNALELSDKRWEYDVGELIASLERVPHQKLIPPTGKGKFPPDDPVIASPASGATGQHPLTGQREPQRAAQSTLADNTQTAPPIGGRVPTTPATATQTSRWIPVVVVVATLVLAVGAWVVAQSLTRSGPAADPKPLAAAVPATVVPASTAPPVAAQRTVPPTQPAISADTARGSHAAPRAHRYCRHRRDQLR